MVTRKDVAKAAGVSVATVSNVLSKRLNVSDEKKEKVLEAAKKLNYIPNHTAKSLSSGRTKHIGVIINDYDNPYHTELAQCVENYIINHGYMMTVIDFNEDKTNMEKLIGEWQFDSLINFSSNIYSKRLLDIFKSKGTVLANFSEDYDINVSFSLKSAQMFFMKKLQELGHKKVGYVSTVDRAWWELDDRGQVFLAEWDKCGFDVNKDYLIFNEKHCKNSSNVGYEEAKILFKKHPDITAVFATNDVAAFGVIRALKDMGLNCPDDVSVIGCDDIMLSSNYVPSLSSISYDKKAYSEEIAKRVVDRLENGTDYKNDYVCIEAKAVVRESIGKAKT